MAAFILWLDSHALFWPIFIFCARVTDVSIGTMRMIFVVRGYRAVAAVLGFFEVTIWVVAVSGVFRHLDHWPNVIAYGMGFATGNAVGMWLEQFIAVGMLAVRLISPGKSAAVAEGLRLAGFGVTEVKGRGYHGDVSISYVVVPRRQTNTVIQVSRQIDPDVFVTVQDVRATTFHDFRNAGLTTGWRAAMKRK